MLVYLTQDVEKIGLMHEIVKVSDGFANNFLIPKKLAIEVTSANRAGFEKRVVEVKNRKQVIESKTSMLAERIGALKLTLKRKMHDDGQLYGAVSQTEVADLLGQQGIKVSKNQVLFDKNIKERGTFPVTIKLSSQLQPVCKVQIIAE